MDSGRVQVFPVPNPKVLNPRVEKSPVDILVIYPDTYARPVLSHKLDIFGQESRPVFWLLGVLGASLSQQAAKNVGQPLVCRCTANKHPREVDTFKLQRGVGSGTLLAAAMGLSSGRFAVLGRFRCHGALTKCWAEGNEKRRES
jgi:hypothetical protein